MSDKDWNYYEADSALCIGQFICDNKKCIDKSKVNFYLNYIFKIKNVLYPLGTNMQYNTFSNNSFQ